MFGLLDCKHRTRRFTNYPFCLTIQQDMRQTGTTMRGDNDHIHVVFPGRPYDLQKPRPPTDDGLTRHTHLIDFREYLLESFFYLLESIRFFMIVE